MVNAPEILHTTDGAADGAVNEGADVATSAAIARAIERLGSGHSVAFATVCPSAIAIALDSPQARAVTRELERAQWHAAASLYGGAAAALTALPVVTPAAAALAKRYFPGPLVLRADDVPTGRSLAVRVPASAIAREILTHTSHALLVFEPWSTTTVAPDAKDAASASHVATKFAAWVDCVVDSGRCALAEPPAVVRADRGEFSVLRAGILSRNDLLRTARRRILFVCAGNTCRSPMAAALLIRALARKLDVSPANVLDVGFEVTSAGAYATPGMTASRGAKAALTEYGIGLAAHRSRPLDLELLQSQDVVFAVTGSILSDLMDAGAVGPQIRHIDLSAAPRDVRDPFGGDDAVYRESAAELETRVESIADWLLAESR